MDDLGPRDLEELWTIVSAFKHFVLRIMSLATRRSHNPHENLSHKSTSRRLHVVADNFRIVGHSGEMLFTLIRATRGSVPGPQSIQLARHCVAG